MKLLKNIKFVLILFIGMFAGTLIAQDQGPSRKDSFDTKALDAKMETAWQTAWTKFYSPKTKLFYDFIESYEPGHELDHLPTEAEVKAQDPNECGYGTAMEDCMISAGVILSMILDRYAVTKEESMRKSALDVFEGIELCATVHGSSGFVARGVSPKAPDLVYINSSRDQVTHAVFSAWEYYRSPLADEKIKVRIRKYLSAVADRMIKNVVPENDYDFLCADGSRCRRGICKMYKVMGHEAARLPMIYAAAWDATGEKIYWNEYRKYIREAVEMSVNLEKNTQINRWVPSYALLQMQVSLNLLYQLEKDQKIKADIRQAMLNASRIAAQKSGWVLQSMRKRDLTEVAPNWRKAGGLNGEYRKTWYAVREAGEVALTQLLVPDGPYDQAQIKNFTESLMLPDYQKISTCGIYDLLGGYWKARNKGIF